MMTNLQQMFAGSHANKLTHTSRVTVVGKALSFYRKTSIDLLFTFTKKTNTACLINHQCLFLYLGQFVTKVLIPPIHNFPRGFLGHKDLQVDVSIILLAHIIVRIYQLVTNDFSNNILTSHSLQ